MAVIVGEQAGALGVSQKVHTQKSTGKAVTGSMDAQVKLQDAQEEAREAKEQTEEVKEEAQELKGILGTLSHEDAAELLAGLGLRTDKLEERVDEGQATLETMKESLNPAIAKLTALIPTTKEGRSEITHITKGQYRKVWGRDPRQEILTKDGKSVRWEYALDEVAQELHLEDKARTEGKNPDEYLKNLIEEARDMKALVKATEAELESDEQTLKALERLKGAIKARSTKQTTGPLLRKIAQPKIKPSVKPRPTTQAKKILASVAQELIQRTQAKRSPRAIAMDNLLLAKKIHPLVNAEAWAKSPNRTDIRGVDTPGRGKIVSGVAYADKGKKRLSRKRHRGFKKIRYT